MEETGKPGKQWMVAGTLVAIAAGIAGGAWYVAGNSAPASPTATSTVATTTASAPAPATTTPTKPAPAKPVATGPFPINSADKLVSWSFTGTYSGNATLTAQAKADVEKLTGLLGKGTYDDYDLYLGIGNDKNLLGDGKGAYDAYNRSIAIHPAKGLAYTNLGHLFDELGAYQTAADAYAKAVAVEPGVLQYHLERLRFLTERLPNDAARIQAGFTDASKQFGDIAQVLKIEAVWLTNQGRYADAISAWKRVELLSPGAATSTIDAEIARLEAKLAASQ